MSISMLIENRRTGQSQDIPICTNSTFHAYWERAAVEEGLEMIQALGGLFLTADHRERFLGELANLKLWTARHTSDEYIPAMVQRIDGIVEMIRSHPLSDYDVSFG